MILGLMEKRNYCSVPKFPSIEATLLKQLGVAFILHSAFNSFSYTRYQNVEIFNRTEANRVNAEI